jgi:hypothetical protein
MISLREKILAVRDVTETELYIAEWGTSVTVRALTALERERFEERYAEAKQSGQIRALVAVMACRNEDGDLIFTEEDIPSLAQKSAAALIRIYDASIRISAISKEDIEALEGNS